MEWKRDIANDHKGERRGLRVTSIYRSMTLEYLGKFRVGLKYLDYGHSPLGNSTRSYDGFFKFAYFYVII